MGVGVSVVFCCFCYGNHARIIARIIARIFPRNISRILSGNCCVLFCFVSFVLWIPACLPTHSLTFFTDFKKKYYVIWFDMFLVWLMLRL